MKDGAAIVWGHGLFTAAIDDFASAFTRLLDIERYCLERYRDIIGL
jgi:hypothetical protein